MLACDTLEHASCFFNDLLRKQHTYLSRLIPVALAPLPRTRGRKPNGLMMSLNANSKQILAG